MRTGIHITSASSVGHNGVLTLWMEEYNSIMSKIRVAIEWSFGSIIVRNKFISFAIGQKIQQNQLAKQYNIAVFLTNCHVCMNGSAHMEYFDCVPPSLDAYLAQ